MSDAIQPLDGKTILIVDDEPIILIDVAQAFEEAGAQVTTSHSFRQALGLMAHLQIAAAIVDHEHGDEDSHELCSLLATRGIPSIADLWLPGQSISARISRMSASSLLVPVLMAQLVRRPPLGVGIETATPPSIFVTKTRGSSDHARQGARG